MLSAALTSSQRTMRPSATSCRDTDSFKRAGQLIATSKRFPNRNGWFVVNSTPALLMFIVCPRPSWTCFRLLIVLKWTSRSIGNRSAIRRSSRGFFTNPPDATNSTQKLLPTKYAIAVTLRTRTSTRSCWSGGLFPVAGSNGKFGEFAMRGGDSGKTGERLVRRPG